MRVAFIGLGVMGYPMAGHLARAGHEVTVYNRTPAKGKNGRGARRRAAATPPRPPTAPRSSALCVGNDDDVRQVARARGARRHGARRDPRRPHHRVRRGGPRDGGDAAARAALPRRAGVRRPGGAENGKLAIMVGGDAAAFERARPVMAAYARRSRTWAGRAAGQLTKMVNQICIAGVVQGLAEALHFAGKAGLDRGLVSRRSPRARRNPGRWRTAAETMLEGKFDFGFAVDWMRKDLGMCSTRRGATAPLAVTALVDSSTPRSRRAAAAAGTRRASWTLGKAVEPDPFMSNRHER